jgi:Zn-dependent protease
MIMQPRRTPWWARCLGSGASAFIAGAGTVFLLAAALRLLAPPLGAWDYLILQLTGLAVVGMLFPVFWDEPALFWGLATAVGLIAARLVLSPLTHAQPFVEPLLASSLPRTALGFLVTTLGAYGMRRNIG